MDEAVWQRVSADYGAVKPRQETNQTDLESKSCIAKAAGLTAILAFAAVLCLSTRSYYHQVSKMIMPMTRR
jgi:hypothetical protein